MTLWLFGIVSSLLHLGLRCGLREAWSDRDILPVYLLFAFPGLIIAAPFVVLFKTAAGNRLWWTVGTGVAIGPAFWLSWLLLASHGHLNWRGDGMGVILSLVIGTLTTGYYVALLRTFARDEVAEASLSLRS